MRTLLIIMAALLALGGTARAQPSASVLSPYDIYFVGDMDPLGISGVARGIDVVLTGFEIGSAWRIDVRLEYNEEWLASGWVEARDIPRTTYTFSVADFRVGVQMSDNPSDRAGGDFNEDFIGQVSGNVLPSGTYWLVVDFMDLNDFHTVYQELPIIIQDARSVELQLPWNGSVLADQNPVFTWTGRAPQFRIRVCNFDPTIHGSPLDAIEGVPMWEAEVSAPTAVYGLGGGVALPLVNGASYVWTVWALLETTSGPRAFPGAVWIFSYAQSGADQLGVDLLLGDLNASQLAGLGVSLEGLQLDGPIMLDGRPISPEELQQIVRDLGSGALNVASVRFE